MHRLIKLLLLCLLLSQLYLLSAKSASTPDAAQAPAIFKQFCTDTGFKGNYTLTNDGRIFTELNGTFDLPVPKDSIDLCLNMDTIAQALNIQYHQKGAEFILKRADYRNSTYSCQYVQYWQRFHLVHQPYFLLITYQADTSTYTIVNELYMKPIIIPDKVISPLTAKTCYEFLFDDENLNPHIGRLPKVYSLTDTVSMEILYDDFTELKLYLNLYSNTDKRTGTEFTLQWRYPNSYYFYNIPHGDYLIDAQTGKLNADAAKYWKEKLPYKKAVKDCVRNMHLVGNCSPYIPENSIVFSEIKIPPEFIDTTTFHQYVKQYLPAILKMRKKLGFDYRFEPKYSRWCDDVGAHKFCEIAYEQIFRYQMTPTEYNAFRISFLYWLDSRELRIDTEIYKNPIVYPKYVLSHQTAIDIYLFNQSNPESGFSYQQAFRAIPKRLVKADSIIYNNVYKDSKNHLTARLCMQQVYGGSYEDVTDIKPVWYIVDDNNPANDTYLNAVTGLNFWGDNIEEDPDAADRELSNARTAEKIAVEQAFMPLGDITEFRFISNKSNAFGFRGKFNLPVVRDSVHAYENSLEIIKVLMKMNNLNPVDYTISISKYEKEDYWKMLFKLYYKGFELQLPAEYHYIYSSVDIRYNEDSKLYDVYYLLNYDIKPFPELVITPETALSIMLNYNEFPYVWTNLSSLSGSKNYTVPELYKTEDETPTGDEFFGSVILKISPFKVKNSVTGEYEYRLVWEVYPYEGAKYLIDAATGEILHEEIWDVC